MGDNEGSDNPLEGMDEDEAIKELRRRQNEVEDAISGKVMLTTKRFHEFCRLYRAVAEFDDLIWSVTPTYELVSAFLGRELAHLFDLLLAQARTLRAMSPYEDELVDEYLHDFKKTITRLETMGPWLKSPRGLYEHIREQRQQFLEREISNELWGLEQHDGEIPEEKARQLEKLIDTANPYEVYTGDLQTTLEERLEDDRWFRELESAPQPEPASENQATQCGRQPRANASRPEQRRRLPPVRSDDELPDRHYDELNSLIPTVGPGAPTAHEIAAALRKAHRAGCQNFDCTFTQFFAWLHDRRFSKKLISDRSGREALKLIFPHTKVIEKDSKTRRLVYRGGDLHEPTSILMTELRAQYSRGRIGAQSSGVAPKTRR